MAEANGESEREGVMNTMVRCPRELWERLRRLADGMADRLPPGVPGPSVASVCRTAIERGCEVLELEEQRRPRR